MTYNALILSYEPAIISALLLNRPEIAVIEETTHCATALTMLQQGHFDLLFLHDILPGCDGLSFLKKMNATPLVTLPRIIYLNEFDAPDWIKLALSYGADSAICMPCDSETLMDTALTAFKHPFPHLGASGLPLRKTLSTLLLRQIGMNEKLKGFDLLARGIAWLSYTGRTDIPLKEYLYQQLAAHTQTTTAAVERNIRTAIDTTWLKGNLEQIQSLFGYSVDANRGKPTNAEVLYMMREYVQKKLYHTSSM